MCATAPRFFISSLILFAVIFFMGQYLVKLATYDSNSALRKHQISEHLKKKILLGDDLAAIDEDDVERVTITTRNYIQSRSQTEDPSLVSGLEKKSLSDLLSPFGRHDDQHEIMTLEDYYRKHGANHSFSIKANNRTLDNESLCPSEPPSLVGRLNVIEDVMDWKDINGMHPTISKGGKYKPEECRSVSKVAVIIPYRDREEHLKIFLNYIHPILQRQRLEYGVYVINQAGSGKFNRAMLFNVGFKEALKDKSDWDCFIFHDVDLLPEDDRNLYRCWEAPRHMSAAVNTFDYKLPYPELFGGVSAMNRDTFESLNGFSNQFWGWGGEDDDMSFRIREKKLNFTRSNADVARYTMIGHEKETGNPTRRYIMKKGKKYYETDGLNNLNYTLLDYRAEKLFTLITVDLFDVWPLSMSDKDKVRILRLRKRQEKREKLRKEAEKKKKEEKEKREREKKI